VKLSADGHNIYGNCKAKSIRNEYDGIYCPDMNVDMPDGKWGEDKAGPSKFRPKRNEIPKYV